MGLRISSPEGGIGGVVARIIASLFFLPFLAIGVWFTILVAHGFLNAVRTYAWNEADCLILESGVDEHPASGEAYRFKVLYTYTVRGVRYTSDRYQQGYSGSSNIGGVQALVDRYRPGSRVRCYVDPVKPGAAMLRRPNLWQGLFIFLPLLFAAVGGWGLYVMWRSKAERERRSAVPNLGKVFDAHPKGCLAAFFSLFLLAGAGTSLFFVRPALKVLAAKSWPSTPCTIVSSRVSSHTSEDSTTYSVEVLFTYTYGGREYKSDRYQFLGGSSGGYEAKERIVRRLPPLTRTTCYVNPGQPSEAVLNRDFNSEYAFVLLPLVFVTVGLGGIVFALRGRS